MIGWVLANVGIGTDLGEFGGRAQRRCSATAAIPAWRSRSAHLTRRLPRSRQSASVGQCIRTSPWQCGKTAQGILGLTSRTVQHLVPGGSNEHRDEGLAGLIRRNTPNCPARAANPQHISPHRPAILSKTSPSATRPSSEGAVAVASSFVSPRILREYFVQMFVLQRTTKCLFEAALVVPSGNSRAVPDRSHKEESGTPSRRCCACCAVPRSEAAAFRLVVRSSHSAFDSSSWNWIPF